MGWRGRTRTRAYVAGNGNGSGNVHGNGNGVLGRARARVGVRVRVWDSRRERTHAANAPARSLPEVPPPGWGAGVGRTPGWKSGVEGSPPPPPAVQGEGARGAPPPPPAVPGGRGGRKAAPGGRIRAWGGEWGSRGGRVVRHNVTLDCHRAASPTK